MSTLIESLKAEIARLQAKHGSDNQFVKDLKEQLRASEATSGKTAHEVYRIQAFDFSPTAEQTKEPSDALKIGPSRAATLLTSAEIKSLRDEAKEDAKRAQQLLAQEKGWAKRVLDRRGIKVLPKDHWIYSEGASTTFTTGTTPLPELKKAFKETHYIVHHQPPFTLRIGHPCPALDELLQAGGHGSAAFITAWNPYAQTLSKEENSTRQIALLADILARGLTSLPGIGQHPDNGWPGEESALVLGINLDAAKALATKYEQLAFVWAPAASVPELVF